MNEKKKKKKKKKKIILPIIQVTPNLLNNLGSYLKRLSHMIVHDQVKIPLPISRFLKNNQINQKIKLNFSLIDKSTNER